MPTILTANVANKMLWSDCLILSPHQVDNIWLIKIKSTISLPKYFAHHIYKSPFSRMDQDVNGTVSRISLAGSPGLSRSTVANYGTGVMVHFSCNQPYLGSWWTNPFSSTWQPDHVIRLNTKKVGIMTMLNFG